MTVFDHLRRRLEAQAGILPPSRSGRTMRELAASQWSDEFEARMRARLIIGAMRYGTFAQQKATPRTLVDAMEKRLRQYKRSGNTECLVDLANCALVEYVIGHHPTKHWSDIQGDHAQPQNSI